MKVFVFSFVLSLALSYCGTAMSQSFSQSLSQLKQVLRNESVTDEQVELAFKQIKRVRKSERSKAAESEDEVGAFGYLEQHLQQVVNQQLVDKTRLYYKNNLPLLKSLELKYKVQPRFLVAIWGINNQLLQPVRGYQALSLLSSLNYSHPNTIPVTEIVNTIKLMSDQTLGDVEVISNWQGKLGLLNMKPSQVINSYQDFDRDGKVDIWANPQDALATAARYLATSGWNIDQTWGRQVRLPKGFDMQTLNDDSYRTLAQWSKMGLQRFERTSLPTAQLSAKLLAPHGIHGRVYLVYKNFELLSLFNDSIYDDIAIGYLANRIKYPAIN